ncbi:unnamed protein product [Pedinophyceae sp. YPF-701]|nr:unnamed protein product [Pedinophyceae sp. YPF-701]
MKSANEFLNEFAESQAAWGHCSAILEASYPAEVQYFCANMLLNKVRSEWRRLDAATKASVSNLARQRLLALSSGPTASSITAQRLCKVVAGIAIQSGAEAVSSFAESAIQLVSGQSPASGAVHTACNMLLAITDESMYHSDAVREAAVHAALYPSLPRVLALVEAVVATRTLEGPVEAALRVLGAWSVLDPHGSGDDERRSFGPGDVLVHAPALLPALLSVMGDSDEVWGEALIDVYMGIGKGTDVGKQRDSEAAEAGLVAALRRVEDSGGVSQLSEGAARTIARLASALMERCTHLIVCPVPGESEQWARASVALTTVVAQLMQLDQAHEDEGLMEACVEYFVRIGDTSVASRRPELQRPLYETLLPVVVRISSFPDGFTTWAESHLEQSSFATMREHVMSDLVNMVYVFFRGEFLSWALHRLAAIGAVGDAGALTGRWQEVEAICHAVRIVEGEVQEDAISHQNAAEIMQHVHALFGAVAGPAGQPGGALASHPMVVATVARMIGAFVKYFSRDDAPMEGCVRYVLRAFAVPEAWAWATKAFRGFCAMCARRLATAPAIQSLMEAARGVLHPAVGADPQTQPQREERAAVACGLARLVAALPYADAARFAPALCAPLLERAQAMLTVVQGSPPPPAARPGRTSRAGRSAHEAKSPQATLADELGLLGDTIRYLEIKPDPGQPHPVLDVMRAAWPTMTAVVESPSATADARVTDALCELCARAAASAGAADSDLRDGVVAVSLTVLERFARPCALEVLSAAVQAAAASKAAEGGGLGEALARACQTCIALLPDSNSVAGSGERPELVAAMFDMCDKFVLFAPALVYGTPELLQALMGVAAHAMMLSERAPVSATCAFVTHALALPPRLKDHPHRPQFRNALCSAVATHGAQLVRSAVSALGTTCPRESLRALGGVFDALLSDAEWRGAVAACLTEAMSPGVFAAAKESIVTPGDCELFLTLVLQGHLTRPRLLALYQDFGQLCRREASADVLLAYQS